MLQPRNPKQLSDETFWSMLRNSRSRWLLSARNNFVSNEMTFKYVIQGPQKTKPARLSRLGPVKLTTLVRCNLAWRSSSISAAEHDAAPDVQGSHRNLFGSRGVSLALVLAQAAPGDCRSPPRKTYLLPTIVSTDREFSDQPAGGQKQLEGPPLQAQLRRRSQH